MILDADIKEKMVEVIKNSDKVIMVKVILEFKELKIVNEYTPQVVCEESQK